MSLIRRSRSAFYCDKTIFQSQSCNVMNFSQRRFTFRRLIIQQAIAKCLQHLGFGCHSCTNDEWHAKFFPIGRIEILKAHEFLVAQLIKAEARLFSCGVIRELPSAREFSCQIRMRTNQVPLLGWTGLFD